jgi:hypothetical protein
MGVSAMSADPKGKTLGQAIDEIMAALRDLDDASRSVAVRAACEELQIPVVGRSFIERTPPPEEREDRLPGSGAAELRSPPALDIRSFTEQKQPASAQEMACVVAYYLQSMASENDRKDAVGIADLDKYFRQADFPLPRRIQQLLIDAKAGGYFDSAGRGTYRLNAVGHNLVAHTLPRPAGAARPATKLPRRPRKTGPKRAQRRPRTK